MAKSPQSIPDPNVVRLVVKLIPKAAQDRIIGWVDQPGGQVLLKVSVTANPEKGQANKAVLKLLAKRLQISLSNIRLEYGIKDQYKRISITINPLRLQQLLEQAIKEDNL